MTVLAVADMKGCLRRRGIARGDGGSAPRERVTIVKVFVLNVLEGGKSAERNRDTGLFVPPPEGRDLGIIPVKDARLTEGCGRRDSAPVAERLVPLVLDQVLDKGHPSLLKR